MAVLAMAVLPQSRYSTVSPSPCTGRSATAGSSTRTQLLPLHAKEVSAASVKESSLNWALAEVKVPFRVTTSPVAAAVSSLRYAASH